MVGQDGCKRGSSETTFVCMICNTSDLDCSNQGWKSVEQYTQKQKHRQKINSLKNNARFSLPMTLTTGKHGFSYRSSNETSELFGNRCPDSNIAQKFSMQHSQMSYLMVWNLISAFKLSKISNVVNDLSCVLMNRSIDWIKNNWCWVEIIPMWTNPL